MRRLSHLLLSGFLVLTMGLAVARAAEPPIQVRDAWARATPMLPSGGHMHGTTGAVYLTLRNGGAAPDALVAAQSDVAGTVELHETTMDGAVMRMRPVAKLALPAGATLEMKPGGLHVMLINLKRALAPGDKIPLTLTFEHAAPLVLEVPVR